LIRPLDMNEPLPLPSAQSSISGLAEAQHEVRLGSSSDGNPSLPRQPIGEPHPVPTFASHCGEFVTRTSQTAR
jgi:hypothetical protein